MRIAFFTYNWVALVVALIFSFLGCATPGADGFEDESGSVTVSVLDDIHDARGITIRFVHDRSKDFILFNSVDGFRAQVVGPRIQIKDSNQKGSLNMRQNIPVGCYVFEGVYVAGTRIETDVGLSRFCVKPKEDLYLGRIVLAGGSLDIVDAWQEDLSYLRKDRVENIGRSLLSIKDPISNK